MRTMDVVLYKLPIIQGQEAVAEEWMDLWKTTPEQVILELLSAEKAYYEAYFTNVEQGILIIYLVFSSEDVAKSNEMASKSNHSFDHKHFDYMKRCVDLDNVQTLHSVYQINLWQ